MSVCKVDVRIIENSLHHGEIVYSVPILRVVDLK